MKITDLKANPKNPRIIKDDKFKKLVKSLQEFPEMMEKRPIVCVTDIDGKLFPLGGNMRLKALQELKYKEIPDEWVMLADEWTEEKRQEFVIKDNVGFGEWDWDALNTDWDLEQLADWGLDVPEWEDEEETPEAKEDDYEIPDTIETDIVLGDLFEIGEHRLMCGDSTDSDSVAKLMNGKKADMVFTSPPYNGNTSVGFKQNKKGGMKTTTLYDDNKSDNKTKDEYIQFNADVFNTIKLIAADDLVILYNINYNRNSPDEFIDVVNKGREAFSLVETIIWEKSMAISLAGDNLTRIFEFIFLFFNGEDKPKMNKTHTNECVKNLWKISNVGANHEIHKACFPVKLVEQGINLYAKDSAILYDPFLGSGSTMVAAHQLNRKCYGMELDSKYAEVIVRRMIKLDNSLTIKRNGVDETQKWLEKLA